MMHFEVNSRYVKNVFPFYVIDQFAENSSLPILFHQLKASIIK